MHPLSMISLEDEDTLMPDTVRSPGSPPAPAAIRVPSGRSLVPLAGDGGGERRLIELYALP